MQGVLTDIYDAEKEKTDDEEAVAELMIQTFSPATSTAFIFEGVMSFDSAVLTKSTLNSYPAYFRIATKRCFSLYFAI